MVGATTPFTEALHLFATASDIAEHNIHRLYASGQPVAMLKAVHNGPGAFKATSRGGGSATATTAMAVPMVKQKVGVVNGEALKKAWHSISRACAVCILENGTVELFLWRVEP